MRSAAAPTSGTCLVPFGPHAIGTERFLAVSSGASFAQVAGAILGKQAVVQISDRRRSRQIRLCFSPKSGAPS